MGLNLRKTMEQIEFVSLAVQIDGQAYFVNATQAELKLLVQISAGFNNPTQLKVVKAPDSFKLMTISDME
jgi:hypothetical protein